MKTTIQIRLSLAPLTFRDRENVKLDFQTRSRLGCAVMPKAFGILLNKDGHCQGQRTAKWERRRCAQVLMRRAEAARLRAASARRRESRPRERDQQRVLFSGGQWQSGWLCDSHGLDLPGTHRPHAKENPRPTTGKILPSSTSRFSVESLTK